MFINNEQLQILNGEVGQQRGSIMPTLVLTEREVTEIRQALWVAHCLQVQHRRAYELFIAKVDEAEGGKA